MPGSPTHRTNYVTLGSATRIPGGWQLGGVSLPEGQHFRIRARGFILEATAGLGPGAAWVPSDGPYPVNAGFHEVVVPNPGQRESAEFASHVP